MITTNNNCQCFGVSICARGCVQGEGALETADASGRSDQPHGRDATGGDGVSDGTVIGRGQERRAHHARAGKIKVGSKTSAKQTKMVYMIVMCDV